MLTRGRYWLNALLVATITFGPIVGVTVLQGDEVNFLKCAFVSVCAGMGGAYGGMRGIARRSTPRVPDEG